MVRFKWVVWGIIFSIVLFLAIYFFIYTKLEFDQENAVLMLGNKDVSFLGVFLSDIKNVIISSLVLGFLLGALTEIRFKKKEVISNQ
jgi:hypothetical protein